MCIRSTTYHISIYNYFARIKSQYTLQLQYETKTQHTQLTKDIESSINLLIKISNIYI